ncbi:MAG: hypothetical protein SPE17_05480 [Alloprevotella sp.]|nr:hypothetical protein [Alloprevotella sp.]
MNIFWQCPHFFIGLSRFFIGLSRFATACFRFSSALCQRPSGGGRVTIGRWSLAISQIKMAIGLARFVTTAIHPYIYIVLCEIHSQTLVQLADVCNFVADKMLVCIISISKIWFARGAL